MMLRVGDRVDIKPTVTITPWDGDITGIILELSEGGTIAVEVESEEKLGHWCSTSDNPVKTDNGWWFMPSELHLREVK